MKLIKIGATWCGPCQMMDTRLKNFTACDYKSYDVDNEDDETLSVIDKYNVRNVPVLVLEGDNGEELKKWCGATALQEIIDEVEKYKVK